MFGIFYRKFHSRPILYCKEPHGIIPRLQVSGQILHFCSWRALIENAAIMTQSNCESDSRNHYEGQDGFCNVLDNFFYIRMCKGIFFAEVRNRMQRKVGL